MLQTPLARSHLKVGVVHDGRVVAFHVHATAAAIPAVHEARVRRHGVARAGGRRPDELGGAVVVALVSVCGRARKALSSE